MACGRLRLSAATGAGNWYNRYSMSDRRSKQAVLDEEFLALRAKVLEIAAGLDRIDRAPGGPVDDSRRERLGRAIRVLLANEPDRAAQVQLLFSREFDERWRDKFGI